ncbi:TPA: hypothetical protein IAC10_03285 [Candidatus Scatousia excrementigallinarum]|uniref:TPR repeat-containing protein n=1 Tax=Candidatus Scatousia excrementigallinarum TaxID=2840935 RepID=A0A9D1EXA0_9BACT|nr:hypothetical protein [Candidatus Scatousia excrementigallinarum]
MGLNLTNINQRPYIKDGRGSVKKKQDEDASKSAAQTEREEQAKGDARSRGLSYVEHEAPKYQEIKPEQWQQMYTRPASRQSDGGAAASHEQAKPVHAAGTPQTRSSNINIAQILKDFRNTASAIATPDDLMEEVNGYLSLIDSQVRKDNPNVKLIKSNLKNASSILDGFISTTLNKDSKVVENWVDALFLQQIDFKYNEEDINPQFLVKFPEGSTDKTKKTKETADEQTPVTETPAVEEQPEQITVKIPQDKELKSLFIQSKKLAYANEPKKAIETFQKALQRADEVGDTETKSKIYYEIGQIYDNHDHLPQALKSYDLSIKTTSDNNVKTKAHYSMAQIYDDANKIEPALDHYFVSVSYGGESDNLAAQSTSLTRIGNIFSDMYEQNAFEYFGVANDLVSETDNAKVKGFVAASTGRAYEKFGEPQEALKSYSNAVKNYTEAESPLKVAQYYVSAADIMIDYNSMDKARGLLKKAQKFAQKTEDSNLINEINDRLSQIA